MEAIPFTQLSDEVLDLYAPGLRAPATRRVMRQVLRELGDVGLEQSSDLNAQAIARWIGSHGQRSPARARSLLRCIRVVANYAVASGRLRASPFAFRGVKAWVRVDPDHSRERRRHKPPEDLRRLLRHLDRTARGDWSSERLRALIYTYTFTAMRRDEALHVLARNVSFADQTITVEPVDDWRPKTIGSSRVLPLAPPLLAVLGEWIPRCGSRWLFPGRRRSSPWRGAQNYKPIDQLREAAEDAGLGRDWSIIGFRKSFGTWAKSLGLGPLEVAAILGHSRPETQAYYDEEKVESLRPAMGRLAQLITH